MLRRLRPVFACAWLAIATLLTAADSVVFDAAEFTRLTGVRFASNAKQVQMDAGRPVAAIVADARLLAKVGLPGTENGDELILTYRNRRVEFRHPPTNMVATKTLEGLRDAVAKID